MSRVYAHCLIYLGGFNRDNVAFPDMKLTYASVVRLKLTLRDVNIKQVYILYSNIYRKYIESKAQSKHEFITI
jgi:hypothetical protein